MVALNTTQIEFCTLISFLIFLISQTQKSCKKTLFNLNKSISGQCGNNKSAPHMQKMCELCSLV